MNWLLSQEDGGARTGARGANINNTGRADMFLGSSYNIMPQVISDAPSAGGIPMQVGNSGG